jgi:hypothetical protein
MNARKASADMRDSSMLIPFFLKSGGGDDRHRLDVRLITL